MQDNNNVRFLLPPKDITLAESDVIINAANGCGYMGGKWATKKLRRGVAEHLNFVTKGKMETEALQEARKYKHIPSWIFGKKPGEFFCTSSHGLNCKAIIHGVTMRYPGSRSKLKDVELLIENIFKFCRQKSFNKIAMPLLGTGTGGLNTKDVINLINYHANDIQVEIYLYSQNVYLDYLANKY